MVLTMQVFFACAGRLRWLLGAFLLRSFVGCGQPATPASAPMRAELPPAAEARGVVFEATAGAASASARAPREPIECATEPAREPPAVNGALPLAEFVELLAEAIDRAAPPTLRAEFEGFAARHGLEPEAPQLFQDYRRLRALFEAVRDGGFWRIRWAITDQEPSSKRIWQAWDQAFVADAFLGASATAECDEISALYSVLARRLGVRGVGLFYPTWNHTIASWTPAQANPKKPFLVLVPTTQIFLACEAGFDSTSFKAPHRGSYEFPLRDLPDARPIPRATAEFLLAQVTVYAAASPELNALLRAHRSLRLGSTMGTCARFRRELSQRVASTLSCQDRRALAYYFRTELHATGGDSLVKLAELAAP